MQMLLLVFIGKACCRAEAVCTGPLSTRTRHKDRFHVIYGDCVFLFVVDEGICKHHRRLSDNFMESKVCLRVQSVAVWPVSILLSMSKPQWSDLLTLIVTGCHCF